MIGLLGCLRKFKLAMYNVYCILWKLFVYSALIILVLYVAQRKIWFPLYQLAKKLWNIFFYRFFAFKKIILIILYSQCTFHTKTYNGNINSLYYNKTYFFSSVSNNSTFFVNNFLFWTWYSHPKKWQFFQRYPVLYICIRQSRF